MYFFLAEYSFRTSWFVFWPIIKEFLVLLLVYWNKGNILLTDPWSSRLNIIPLQIWMAMLAWAVICHEFLIYTLSDHYWQLLMLSFLLFIICFEVRTLFYAKIVKNLRIYILLKFFFFKFTLFTPNQSFCTRSNNNATWFAFFETWYKPLSLILWVFMLLKILKLEFLCEYLSLPVLFH